MYDVGESLRAAFGSAAERLLDAQRAVARANAGQGGGRAAGRAMAQTAQAAIFGEALMEAERARLAELKAAAR